MNLSDIKELIDVVNNSDLQEAIIEEGNFKLILRRPAPVVVQQAAPAAIAPTAMPAPTYAAPAPQATAPAAKPAPTIDTSLIECRSPIVGTFYHASSPDTPPFVSINDTIKKGDVLCIIEAMKLMNEIEAEVSGTIVEILVENGQAVEYDQPLFRIKP
uniref:Biotin carboxyl carrier protein of acetyl-CoA carboxylase n=1 Tax=Chlorobium chlorochromatii (strain CaD3) TaxID=340177 RepID=Q3ATP2_CHLCH